MTGDSHSEGGGGLSRITVVQTGRRRRWSDEQKARIVDEATAGGASLRAVARRHEVDPGQIYTWRRRFGTRLPCRNDGFAAVMVSRDPPSPPNAGRMEVVSRNGRRVIVDADVDLASLSRLLAMLER